jgi:hypothetical protein
MFNRMHWKVTYVSLLQFIIFDSRIYDYTGGFYTTD